jgi:hypothetical protein
MMKKRLYPFLLAFIPVTCASQDWTVMTSNNEYPANYVYITGETNINCFECKYDNKRDDQNSDNVLLKHPQIPGQTIETQIPINEFECSNSMMYNDFQKLLKGYEFPYIKIEIDPSQIKNILPYKQAVDLDVAITIADVKNVQSISCSVISCEDSNVKISGVATINLADFRLKPPVKFMGLVKVKDEVIINFSFNFIVV